jgi:hypothetical protein
MKTIIALASTCSVATSAIVLSMAAFADPASDPSKQNTVVAETSISAPQAHGTKDRDGGVLQKVSDNQIAGHDSGSKSKKPSKPPTDQLANNVDAAETYNRAVDKAPEVSKPYAQAEDGQGTYKLSQVQSAQAENGVDLNGGEPPMQAPVAIGRPGGVTNELDLALGQRQIYSDLRSLQDRIILQQQPVANAVGRYSTQSDGVEIAREEISQDFFFSEGASRLRPGVQLVKYIPSSGNNSVFEFSGGADGSYRINDFSAITGDFWLNNIEPKHMADNLVPTYDMYLTLWPNDLLRLDIDNKRETFDNITSLQMGITSESIGGSIDYTPIDDLRVTVRAGGSFYSDTNDRESGEAEAVWRVMSLPILEVGIRASAFSFSKQLNNGYFNPDTYISGEAMFRLRTDLTDQLNVELAGSGGVEHANPGGDKPLVKASLQFAYRLVKNWSLDGGLDYFSSQESTSSGFARTSYTLGLHYRFE